MDRQHVAPLPGKWRSWGKILLLSAGFVTVVVGLLVGVQLIRHVQTERVADDLRAAVAEVDQAEPDGWQMDDLERQREKIPNADNGSNVVLAAAKLLPKGWNEKEYFLEQLPPPVRLRDDLVTVLRGELEKLRPALQEARKLVDYPKGRFPPLRPSRDWFSTKVTHQWDARDVAFLLFVDALLRCEEGDYPAAWNSAIAVLHASRSLGDEPLILSQVVRMGGRTKTVTAMERILAHGVIDETRLAQAREAITRETHQRLVVIMLRAERAGQHLFYTSLAKKELTPEELASVPNQAEVKTILPEVNDTEIAESHAYTLRAITEAVACTKQAEPERSRCMNDLDCKIKDGIARKTIPRLAGALTPVVHRIDGAELRTDTQLECAAAALAAEQFRLRSKHWPKDLAELVNAKLLPKVPLDYDGQPLRLRHAKDGLVIYSLYSGSSYEGTTWDDVSEPGAGLFADRVEFRLWDPEHRRQPPLPPPPP